MFAKLKLDGNILLDDGSIIAISKYTLAQNSTFFEALFRWEEDTTNYRCSEINSEYFCCIIVPSQIVDDYFSGVETILAKIL